MLLDAAQAVPLMRVDLQALDVEFYAFSGHKVFGPTGIGILYGLESLFNEMPPYQGGGDMIERVTLRFLCRVSTRVPSKSQTTASMPRGSTATTLSLAEGAAPAERRHQGRV